MELIPKAAVDPASAKALLGLALCHIARCDGGWRDAQEVNGRRAGEDIPCKLRRALWIGDLLYRAWLPAKGEDGKTIGAVGASGDTGDNDEICIIAGIEAAGLIADAGA